MIEGKRAGSILCYVVRPEYRGRSVARTMLRRAVADFREKGYDAVLTLPVDIRDEPQRRYRGTLHMYEEMDFNKIQQKGPVSFMWLGLKAQG